MNTITLPDALERVATEQLRVLMATGTQAEASALVRVLARDGLAGIAPGFRVTLSNGREHVAHEAGGWLRLCPVDALHRVTAQTVDLVMIATSARLTGATLRELAAVVAPTGEVVWY